MSNRTINLDDRLFNYLVQQSLIEPEIPCQVRQETALRNMAVMQISPEQGQFMAMLMKIIGVRRAIEVGVFTGYSSLSMALAMPNDAEIIACDINREWTSVARRYWQEAGVEHKISLYLRPALETLDELLLDGQAELFDFAFIDADKTNYCDYYEKCLRLIRPGGVIAIDNVLWDGAVADENQTDDDTVAIRQLNDMIFRDERVDISLIPIGDGLTLARRKEAAEI